MSGFATNTTNKARAPRQACPAPACKGVESVAKRGRVRNVRLPRKSEAKRVGKMKLEMEMAERVRFELTCRNYPTIRFRVGAVMTASVPLRTGTLDAHLLNIRAAPRGARILAER